MANLILSRPQAQAHQALNVPPGSRLVLDFPTDQATLERAGDNLAFSFEDGSRIELTNFYNEYSRADLPDFEVNGELVAGEKFFEAFAPDLLPAAGPARTARETHAAGSEDDGVLMHGLDHLDGLNGVDGSQVAPTAPESGPAPVSSPLGRGFNESGGDFAESAGPGESGGGSGGDSGDPDAPKPGEPGGVTLIVNEHGLTSTADTSESATLTPPDGFSIAGVVTQGSHGQLAKDASGNWVYTLNGAIDSGSIQGTNTVQGADTVTVTMQDADGNKFDVNIKVDVIDDVPTLNVSDALTNVTSGQSTAEAPAGSFGFDFGADSGDGKTFMVNGHEFKIPTDGEPTRITGDHGTLTVNADGSYSYQANPNTSGTDKFDFVITDADGDRAEASIDVQVDAAQGPVFPTDPSDPDAPKPGEPGSDTLIVNEHGLTSTADTSESATLTPPDGFSIAGVVTQGSHGQLAKDASGNWVYTLNGAIDSGSIQGANTVQGADTVTVTMQDADGNMFDVNIKVDVIDDVPTLNVSDALTNVTSGQSTAEAPAGSFAFDFGADSGEGKTFTVNGKEFKIPTEGHSTEITGDHGTLTVNADGSYSYQANPDTSGTDSFDFVITDADGDKAQATIDVTVDAAPYLEFVEKNADHQMHIAEGEVSIDPVLHGNLASVFRFGGLEQGGSLRLDVAYTDGKGGAHNYVFTWSDGALSVADAQGNAVDPADLPFGLNVDAANGLASFYKTAGVDPETGETVYNQSHVLDVSATLTGSDGAQLQSGPHHLEADGAPTPAQGEPWWGPGDGGVSLAGGAGTDYMVGGDHSDLLEGGLGADKLYGGAGDDTLIGSWKMDGLPSEDFTVKGNLLDGGSGNDMLFGARLFKHGTTVEAVQLMTGGTLTVTGNTLLGGEGDDYIYGANLSSSSDFSSVVVMSGGAQLTVSGNTLDGGAGRDQIYGANLSAISSSSVGMSGGAQLTVSGNTLDGGAGRDQIYGANLSAISNSSVGMSGGALTVEGNQLLGGDGDDQIYGAKLSTSGLFSFSSEVMSGGALTVEANQLLGGDGNDQIYGAQLGDSIITSSIFSFDSVGMGGGAQLTVSGNTLDGGAGRDEIYGAQLSATSSSSSVGMSGGAQLTVTDNTLLGGDGDDQIYGAQLSAASTTSSSFVGMSGGAQLTVTDNTLLGGDGDDWILGARLFSTATVMSGEAQLTVSGNTLDGGAGRDQIRGASLSASDSPNPSLMMEGEAQLTVTDNTLLGGEGDDQIYGASLSYFSTTSSFSSTGMSGGAQLTVTDNTLLGGDGDDRIFGASFSFISDCYSSTTFTSSSTSMSGEAQLTVSGNTLDGGAGRDQIYGAQLSFSDYHAHHSSFSSTGMSGGAQLTVTDNTLLGGDGDDQIYGAQLSASDSPNPSLMMEGEAQLTVSGNTLDGGAGRDQIYGASFCSSYSASSTGMSGGAQLTVTDNTLLGGDGDDRIFGASLFSTATVMSGEAQLTVTDNTLLGGDGDDQITGLHIKGDIKDHAVVDFSHNQLLGGDGDDVIRVEDIHSNYISPDATLHITDNYLDGGAGADTIIGGRGTDIIAYDKADTLVDGGAGTDFLLVGGDDDLNVLFGTGPGALGQTVQSVEVVLSGNGAESLTDFEALTQHGINVSGGDIHLGEGWQQAGAAHDGYNTWVNGDLTLNVSQDTTVTYDAATASDPANEAAMKMTVENS